MRVLLVSEGKHEQTGALMELIRRLSPHIDEPEQERVSRNNIHAHHGRGQGYFKKAVRWLLEAQKRGFEGLILLIDEDHQPDRTAQINAAQESGLASIRRALGTAIPTFDSWMLADEECLSRVLGRTIQRQPDPETTRDAKEACRCLLNDDGGSMGQAEMYAALAREVDLAVLEQRCSRGFAPFAARVRALA